MTSCTGALHLALLALDIGPGDEVITTPMSFVATATAILEAGATPVFVDVEADTGNLDAARVEAAITPNTRAIMPVHLYGLMCDMRALKAIADKHRLRLIEDAAHCIEGVRDGVRPGDLSDAACFSFYATKNLTCGEGGAITVNDAKLAERLKLLRLHGMTRMGHESAREGYRHWDMVLMGWKYNMSNVEAALLLPQFERMRGQARAPARAGRALRAGVRAAWTASSCRARGRQRACPARLHGVVRGLRPRRPDRPSARRGHRRGGQLSPHPPDVLLRRALRLPPRQPSRSPKRIGDRTVSLPLYPDMPLEHVDVVAQAVQGCLDRSRQRRKSRARRA